MVQSFFLRWQCSISSFPAPLPNHFRWSPGRFQGRSSRHGLGEPTGSLVKRRLSHAQTGCHSLSHLMVVLPNTMACLYVFFLVFEDEWFSVFWLRHPTSTHTASHLSIRPSIRTYIDTYIYTYRHTHTQTSMHPFVHACRHACLPTYLPAYRTHLTQYNLI